MCECIRGCTKPTIRSVLVKESSQVTVCVHAERRASPSAEYMYLPTSDCPQDMTTKANCHEARANHRDNETNRHANVCGGRQHFDCVLTIAG